VSDIIRALSLWIRLLTAGAIAAVNVVFLLFVSVVACGSETSDRLAGICDSFRRDSLAVFFVPTFVGLGGAVLTTPIRGRARVLAWAVSVALAVVGLVAIVLRYAG
jgi:hypothetical protein